MKRTKEDAIFSDYIRAKANHTCQRCYKEYPRKSRAFHCCHVFSRGGYIVRFDETNALAMCRGCHSWFDNRATKEEKKELYDSIFGEGKYDELESVAKRSIRSIGKTKNQIKEEAYTKYKALMVQFDQK